MIAKPRRTLTRSRFSLVLLAAVALAAVSCTIVGQGNLHVANDLSGIGVDNTTLRAFAPDTGDPWPPAGFVDLFVKGDDFGQPPTYGMNGYLYLVRTDLACPESEGAPEAFTLADVTLVGIVTVTNGSVNQNVTMLDTTANRQSHWALIEINELAGFPGLHLIHRCGEVTWTGSPQATADPCTLRTSLAGQALSVGKFFALDANTQWQFCYGGAAAGSNEKFLFRTDNGGTAWTLISRTTLGTPPAESGVGELPNGNGVSAFFFQDADKGWLGLSSPGHNLLRSTDGGHNWSEVVVPSLASAVPVESITFADATHGVFTTPDGTWTTADGGTTWVKAP
ncbi:MAG: hypothetical protein AAB349_03815 [Chloroflexota bacterium]